MLLLHETPKHRRGPSGDGDAASRKRHHRVSLPMWCSPFQVLALKVCVHGTCSATVALLHELHVCCICTAAKTTVAEKTQSNMLMVRAYGSTPIVVIVGSRRICLLSP